MRHIILGAGAVGGTLGGLLSHHGHSVVLVARGAHLDALRTRGLSLRTPEQTARVEAEGAAVLAAAGVARVSDDEERNVRRDRVEVAAIDGAPRGGGSSWQSLQRGAGTIESDYLNGEIVLMGRLHGVPTPLNATLQRLAARAVRERWAPGHLSPEELDAHLDSALRRLERSLGLGPSLDA
jgi:ketopantoate reductase